MAISGGPAATRRTLLRITAAAGAAATIPRTAVAEGPNTFLNDREMILLGAITARLIPADQYTPSAAEMGVPVFISRQLAGAFGQAGHTYMQGPFAPGTPQQGYQSEWKPADMYRAGLARFDTLVPNFEKLAPEQQDAAVRNWEAGHLDLTPVPAAVFFEQVLANTTEGFFADPSYGGNKDMASWRMIGFPGAHAAYREEVERYDVPYGGPPVSLADYKMRD